jgi:arginase family enzyme
MQLNLLELDDAFEGQTDFIQTCEQVGTRRANLRRDGKVIRVWGYHHQIDSLREKIAAVFGATTKLPLTFIGSGDFHHVTAVLQGAALEHQVGPVTVIHIDNHPDWVIFKKGLHCGSWINTALANPKVEKVITLGVCSSDLVSPERKLANLPLLSQGKLELYPYDHPPSEVSNQHGSGPSFEQVNGHLHWKTIKATGEQDFIGFLLSRIKTKAVYITIDKDALVRGDAITNWGQGQLRLSYVLTLIREIGAHHNVIGADVIGDYSRRLFAGGLKMRISKYKEFMRKRSAERPDPAEIARINAAANQALLKALSEVMV